MSDATETPATSAGPQPDPLRFFGTTWVDHTDGYTARRAAVAVGSLAAAVAACLVLRFAYQGLGIADVGKPVTLLVVVMSAVCSALAFGHTWGAFTRFLRGCPGVHAGEESHPSVATRSVAVSAPAEPGNAHTGRFCCSMYCLITVSGAPPAVPAKEEPDHSLLARQ